MDSELIFYTNPISRGSIVRWMLEEVGEPYQTLVLEFETSMKSEEYLAINPMGKVPSIKHGDVVVTECAAICAYLADAFPDAGLAPPVDQRAEYYRWLFFGAGPIELSYTVKTIGTEMTPEYQAMFGFGTHEHVENALESWLKEHKYIIGSTFTAADVYVASHIMWGMEYMEFSHRPVFKEYTNRTNSRPAATRARELDFALMPKDDSLL